MVSATAGWHDQEPKVCRPLAGGRWIRNSGSWIYVEQFFTPLRSLEPQRPGSRSRVLTTDNGKFTVRRARLAPAMISTPGHRASRRRQTLHSNPRSGLPREILTQPRPIARCTTSAVKIG